MEEQQKTSTVLLPLDGTKESNTALLPARAAAKSMSAALHIIHVAPNEMSVDEMVHKLGLKQEDTVGVVFHVATGDPVSEIVKMADRISAGLIVMTTHGIATSSHPGITSVVEQVVQESDSPVLSVRPETIKTEEEHMKRVRRILVPLDGTPTAATAVKPAAEIAIKRDAELLILHIATSGNRLPKEPGTYMVGRYMDQPQHEWPLWAREFLERLIITQSELISKLRLRLHLASGDPSEEIIHFARDHKIDVIVTAWQGRTPLDESKVIRPLLRYAPCPVLIVRTKFDEEPGMTKSAGSNRN